MRPNDDHITPVVNTISRRKVLGWSGILAASLTQTGAMPFALAYETGSQAKRKNEMRARMAAKPSPIDIDLLSTAVVVIDMQNDFASKGGMLDRLGADISSIQKAIEPTAAVIKSARQVGLKIIYLKMAMKPDLSDIGPVGSPNQIAHSNAGVGTKMRAPDGSEGRILIQNTWNTAVIEQLKPELVDIQIYKHRYSGFFETDLDATLKHLGIHFLIVTGCTTSVCVESTIRDAMFRDYSAILLEDCTGEPFGNDPPRSNHDASISVIAGRNFGWVSSSRNFLDSVREQASL